MTLSQALKQVVDRAKASDGYWVEKAKLDFSQILESHRRSVGMTYAQLAQKLGTSAAYISKVFRGDANLTIESMVKLARVTGGELRIEIVPEGKVAAQQWGRQLISFPRGEAANQRSISMRSTSTHVGGKEVAHLRSDNIKEAERRAA